MITFLDGILEEKQPARVVMNVGGVGYAVAVPLCCFDRLPPQGQSARLLIYHHITDSSQALFGFSDPEERRLFSLLLGVSGIGPKIAVSALSSLSVRELKAALIASDIKQISSISGIGKKTAERMVIELRDKLEASESLAGAVPSSGAAPAAERNQHDAALALISLGYRPDEARKMIQKVAGDSGASTEALIRKALTGK